MANTQQLLLTTDEMYQADRLAIENGQTGFVLMERAGRAVAEVAGGMLGDRSGRSVLILAGPGKNGGDGFVAARALFEKGHHVLVCCPFGTDGYQGESLKHFRLLPFKARGTPVFEDFLDADLIVDALFGAGLSRPLEGMAAHCALWAKESGTGVLSVDVPSGYDGSSGKKVGDIVFSAEKTVTFFRKRRAHCLYPAKADCGEIICADIGIDDAVLERIAPDVEENVPALWKEDIPQRQWNTHKYHFGQALIACGEMPGATVLASRACQRTGAGLVRVLCNPELKSLFLQNSASLVLHDQKAEAAEISGMAKLSALMIGQGGGTHPDLKQDVLGFLEAQLPTVLDADGLSVFRDAPDELFAKLHRNCVLTPHEGEFSRLFPGLDPEGDRIEAVRQAARQAGAVVLLKGASTIIADPDGMVRLSSPFASFHLATAGSGDVLGGIICGLLAQGLTAFQAASAGAWLHSCAGYHLGQGLIADDLPEALPAVFEQLRSV
ncbi:NAD(P)H-hydrate dehydratase [Kiloniella sp. b19]|uniref:NAD(P)H-hydrate dehydratase n=1 Tax=Kiloniella sp. GXU_MW_B19 TaxID=3141326 RepID=UPI0031DBB0B2